MAQHLFFAQPVDEDALNAQNTTVSHAVPRGILASDSPTYPCTLSLGIAAMMVRRSKWVEDTAPDEPVAQVARRAIEARLDLVWHLLPRATTHTHDIENVHQLRVSTRRAMAVMQIFDELLPPRRALWFDERLKRIRQAANDARDFDVLKLRLEQLDASTPEDAKRLLLERVAHARAEAQEPIRKIESKLSRKNIPRRQAALLKRVRLRGKADQLTQPNFGQAARRALRPIVDDFFAAARVDLQDYPALHAFRIQGKQLRYAMEIFAGAFAPEFRGQLYPTVETLQARLGEINDHATAKAHYAGWLEGAVDPVLSDFLKQMIAGEELEMAAARERFFDWWTAQRSDELRSHLGELLARESAS